MHGLTEQQKGEWYTFGGALFWAVFPVMVVLSYATLQSLVSLLWSTGLAALFFAAVMTYRKRWGEIQNPRLWKNVLMVTLFIGVLFYSLYYIGLETTSPGNVAIITLFEVFTSFVFFRLFRGERLSFDYALGAIFMVIGAAIVLAPNFAGVRVGDFIVLAATFFAPAGNYFQQRAREIASAESIMFLRSTLSLFPIFALVYFFGQKSSSADIVSASLFLIVNGILLLGLSKLFWIEAIHRISVTKATALSSIAPFFTLLVAWVALSQEPTLPQLLSLIPFVLGTLLLTDQIRLMRA
ncbi:DMT family transporter [Candidatus Kaiserbacteria bacterium]|nr:DMT family transporter [Candidatus Kaiserbacteria bacterium]